MSSAMFDRMARAARDLAVMAALDVSLDAVAARRQISKAAMRRVRSRPLGPARARQEALYLAVTHWGLSERAVARHAGLDNVAVNKACHAVEDRRGEPAYDRELDELELAMMEPAAP